MPTYCSPVRRHPAVMTILDLPLILGVLLLDGLLFWAAVRLHRATPSLRHSSERRPPR